MTIVHTQITLSEPRPGQERAQNVYVDAPLPKHHSRTLMTNGSKSAATDATASSPAAIAAPSPHSSVTTKVHNTAAAAAEAKAAATRTKSKAAALTPAAEMPPQKKQLQGSSSMSTTPIETSSLESLARRSKGESHIMAPPLVPPAEEDSIICRRCGRCRCHACRAPRRLPERWLCDNSVHVSASSVVSCLSCMCAADAVLYHCGKDTLEDTSTGNIKGGKWRWVCAAALSLIFPCLCCYLPLKGCQKVTEVAYAKAMSNGCRCDENLGGDRVSSNGDRRNNVITSIPISPMTALSSAPSSSAISSPVSGSGGITTARAKKTGDSFEQKLLL